MQKIIPKVITPGAVSLGYLYNRLNYIHYGKTLPKGFIAISHDTTGSVLLQEGGPVLVWELRRKLMAFLRKCPENAQLDCWVLRRLRNSMMQVKTPLSDKEVESICGSAVQIGNTFPIQQSNEEKENKSLEDRIKEV